MDSDWDRVLDGSPYGLLLVIRSGAKTGDQRRFAVAGLVGRESVKPELHGWAETTTSGEKLGRRAAAVIEKTSLKVVGSSDVDWREQIGKEVVRTSFSWEPTTYGGRTQKVHAGLADGYGAGLALEEGDVAP